MTSGAHEVSKLSSGVRWCPSTPAQPLRARVVQPSLRRVAEQRVSEGDALERVLGNTRVPNHSEVDDTIMIGMVGNPVHVHLREHSVSTV